MKRQKIIELDSEKTKFNIDYDAALADEEVPELQIIRSDKTPVTISGVDSAAPVHTLDDDAIEKELTRLKSMLSLSERLPDKGQRIGTRIGNLEYEKQRRLLRRTKDTDNCQIISPPSRSSGVLRQAITASKDMCRQVNTRSKDVSSTSIFDGSFSEKPKMDAKPVKLFNEQVQVSGRGGWKGKADRETKTDQNNGWRSLPNLRKCQVNEENFYSRVKDSKRNRKPNEASVKRKLKDSSPYLLVDDDDDDEEVIGYDTPREWSLKASPSQNSSFKKKSDDKVIHLDEDEPQSPIEVEEAFELPEGLPEEICYPSRDDPELVELSLKDLKCLSPQQYLTSPVINFYIRFLQHQVFSDNQTAANCHFFNTFFYKKLIEAVSYKGNDKDAFFVKFRRWWKGLDLFCKSYIFIPIHEDLHWSLVIICIPDKEDESGLTIIHLDSLGLHPREVIFNNVKKFLKEEWNYLKQDALSSDLPISEEIWKDLPNRIIEAEVKAPQQKNDFDCGLFVLFFITKFIEEAPERMKLEDLGMVHKKWFKPKEASALRLKILKKLVDLFRDSNLTD